MADRAKIIDILEAVAELITAAELPLKVAAERTYAPAIELKDPNLRVFVYWPGEVEIERLSREKRSEKYAVEVAVMKRVSVPSTEQCDQLANLCEAIGDLLFVTQENPQEHLGEAVCMEVSQSRFDYERLTDANEFSYVWQLIFQVIR